MSREIKFRAWDEVNKKMVYSGDLWTPQKGKQYPLQKVRVCGCYIIYPYCASSKSYVRVYNKEGKGSDYYNDWDYDKLYSTKLIFEQFTGLKDKSGREIYEGDVLQMPGPNERTPVGYSPKLIKGVVGYKEGTYILTDTDCGSNPELLGEKE